MGRLDSTPRRRLREILLETASKGLAMQTHTGAMPAGHNGPYHHPETPMRNTAHWAILFARAWELSDHWTYYTAGEQALDYLLATFQSTGHAAIPCRIHQRKDATNGVMGPAWIIEALVESGRRLSRPDAIGAAATLFSAHPYRWREGAWQRLGPEGRPKGFDWTFNHQLWFCAVGALLVRAGHEQAAPSVRDFIGRLGRRLRLTTAGRIEHANNGFIDGGPWTLTHAAARSVYFRLHTAAMRDKSLGYHCFNTYALALIHQALPDCRVFEKTAITRALAYLYSEEFWESVGESTYGFPYNPSGLEAAFTLDLACPGRPADADRWIERQIAATYDPYAQALVQGTADPATARARTYEAARLV
jgi:hypothetical protein